MVCSFFHISVSLSGKWNSNSGESSGFLGPGHCGNTESQRQNASWREQHSSRVSLEGLPTEKAVRMTGQWKQRLGMHTVPWT